MIIAFIFYIINTDEHLCKVNTHTHQYFVNQEKHKILSESLNNILAMHTIKLTNAININIIDYLIKLPKKYDEFYELKEIDRLMHFITSNGIVYEKIEEIKFQDAPPIRTAYAPPIRTAYAPPIRTAYAPDSAHCAEFSILPTHTAPDSEHCAEFSISPTPTPAAPDLSHFNNIIASLINKYYTEEPEVPDGSLYCRECKKIKRRCEFYIYETKSLRQRDKKTYKYMFRCKKCYNKYSKKKYADNKFAYANFIQTFKADTWNLYLHVKHLPNPRYWQEIANTYNVSKTYVSCMYKYFAEDEQKLVEILAQKKLR